jgi:hypothetical protein
MNSFDRTDFSRMERHLNNAAKAAALPYEFAVYSYEVSAMPCLRLLKYGVHYGTLTVVLDPHPRCAPNEIIVKTWGGNEDFTDLLMRMQPPLFEDTGKRYPTGFVQAQVWRILNYSAEQE